ncbi:hypothetical protein ACHAWF_018960 [Thalassiosira exigua]
MPIALRGRSQFIVAASAAIQHLRSGSWAQFSESFCTPKPTPILLGLRRLELFRNGAGADRSAFTNGDDEGSERSNKKSVLGESLDLDFKPRDGTYSWSNPKDCPPNQSSSQSTSPANSESNHYKLITFDGCGPISHQQPEDFIEPNAVDESDYGASNQQGRRSKGRTGVSLWSASYVISNYIDAQWSKGGAWYCGEGSDSEPNWTVLELGAGLGLCSAVAAKYGMNVVSTDNDPAVLLLLKENLRKNHAHCNDEDASKQHLHAHALDWTTAAKDPRSVSSHPVFLDLESRGGADLILLSDVIYGATQPAWGDLLRLLNMFRDQRRRIRCGEGELNATTSCTNCNPSVKATDPIVLLGYTQRRRDMSPQDEARFFALLDAAGMDSPTLIPSTQIPHGDKYMLTSLFELRWKPLTPIV